MTRPLCYGCLVSVAIGTVCGYALRVMDLEPLYVAIRAVLETVLRFVLLPWLPAAALALFVMSFEIGRKISLLTSALEDENVRNAILEGQMKQQQVELTRLQQSLDETYSRLYIRRSQNETLQKQMDALLAEQERQRLDFNKKCCVCWTNDVRYYNYPCGHCNLCKECHMKVDLQCPECRGAIQSFWKAHL